MKLLNLSLTKGAHGSVLFDMRRLKRLNFGNFFWLKLFHLILNHYHCVINRFYDLLFAAVNKLFINVHLKSKVCLLCWLSLRFFDYSWPHKARLWIFNNWWTISDGVVWDSELKLLKIKPFGSMIQPYLDNDLEAFNSKLEMFHNTHLVWNGYQICYGP